MPLPEKLLEILVCPQSKGPLEQKKDDDELFCETSKLRYPVRNNVPILFIDQSVGASGTLSKSNPKVTFNVVSGPDLDLVLSVEYNTCKAVCRASSNSQKTAVVNLDLTLALDQNTKSLIQTYVLKKFKQKSKKKLGKKEEENYGHFRRAPDLHLHDPGLSKLHLMIFVDSEGRTGVLDLVSKNGTFVNGKEVESCFLSPGDVLQISSTKLVFEG